MKVRKPTKNGTVTITFTKGETVLLKHLLCIDVHPNCLYKQQLTDLTKNIHKEMDLVGVKAVMPV